MNYSPPINKLIENTKLSRYQTIDGLRGYLAFGVYIHHCVITKYFLQTGHWELTHSSFYNQLGQTSVVLFFMITAFLFWGKVVSNGQKIVWKDLYISRLFRLVPLYLLVLTIIFTVIFIKTDLHSFSPPLSNFKSSIKWLLFTLPGNPSINGINPENMTARVIWTLRYEWTFYVSLPFLGFLFAKTGKPFWAFSTITVLVMLKHCGWLIPCDPNILMSFLGGIFATYWVRSPYLLSLSKNPFAGTVAFLCLGIVLFFSKTAMSILPIILLTVFFTIISSGNSLFGVLRPAYLRLMGEISYSTYLIHGFLLWFVFQNHLSKTSGLFYDTIAILLGTVLIIVSTVTYLYIEKPGILLGKKVIRLLANGKFASSIKGNSIQ